jgi:hypothetical protein
MPESNWRASSAFAKAFAVFGIGAVVGLGLCGIGVAANLDSMNIIALGLFVLSLLGLLITGVVWILVEIYDAVRR